MSWSAIHSGIPEIRDIYWAEHAWEEVNGGQLADCASALVSLLFSAPSRVRGTASVLPALLG